MTGNQWSCRWKSYALTTQPMVGSGGPLPIYILQPITIHHPSTDLNGVPDSASQQEECCRMLEPLTGKQSKGIFQCSLAPPILCKIVPKEIHHFLVIDGPGRKYKATRATLYYNVWYIPCDLRPLHLKIPSIRLAISNITLVFSKHLSTKNGLTDLDTNSSVGTGVYNQAIRKANACISSFNRYWNVKGTRLHYP